MSLKKVKTIGYDFFVDHLLWAFDLYDSNRNARLKGKRSYSSKQDVYVDELHEKLIQTLCDQSRDVSVLVNGLLDFSEVAASYVLSKSVVTSLSKEQIYQRYAKHILCPLLVAYMEIFSEFHDESPLMLQLDILLLSTNEQGVAHAARKILLSILAAPECAHYREELTEFIRDIRPDRTQRRATIEQKIRLAKTTCSDIEKQEEKQKSLLPLTHFQEAYAACMAAIYFDIKTGLGCHLARLYKIASTEKTDFSDIRVNSLSSSIVKFIATQQHIGNALPKDAKVHLDKLWEVAIKGVPLITSPYIRKNINTIFYLLGKPGFSIERITNHKKSEKFFHCVATQKDMFCLKPYALILQVLYHVKNEQLQEALDLLESEDACLLDDTTASLSYYASILLLGLTIKTDPLKLKNGNLNPLTKIIINTQAPYADIRLDSANLLNMEFEPFISDSYTHSILRSIREYNLIVSTNLSSPQNRTHLSILDTWNGVEALLEKIYAKLVNVSTNDRMEAMKSLLTKADKEKILITYISNSTLYHCVRELDSLLSYLPISTENYPYIQQLIQDIEYRKALLMTLDPEQYEKDTTYQPA
ncbi:hypothetical protein MNZ22_11855 [Aeromonas encheleia]|uniref:hypothetical protein n=1 Tax=Aeromonas encheleia TaxID=73010 RepID=UPI001F5A6980|nr:hypothetical protein [Aeromonas encheleia]UNP87529.1 hypothetical protein MNZ22_11855 [Aeromonas encheleia]